MRSKNGRFTKKDVIEDEEVERIREFEYTDLWIYKVVDTFTKALVGLLLRLAIQIFFILLFAMLLKKIGLLDLLKEIFNMIYDIFNFAKNISGTKQDDGKNTDSNGVSSQGKSYFS